MSPARATPPLVILAIDSADIELVTRWTESGHMPTLAGIMQAGCFLKIDGADLVNEMGSWISLHSGVAKTTHGFYSVRQLVPGTYTLVQTNAAVAKNAPPFWRFLRGGTKKAAIVDPPELDVIPDVPGVQLTNWAAHESERLWEMARSLPEHVLSEVRAKFGSGEKLATFAHRGTEEEDFADYQRALARIATKGLVCRDVIGRDDFDVVVATFFEAHTIGHRLWSYQPEFAPPNRLSNGLRDLYEAIDGELARTLAELSADANVFIVSAYGMAGMYPTTGLMDAFLHQLDYQVPLRTEQLITGNRFDPLTLLRRAIPQPVRKWVSQFLPANVQERLIASDFAANTDWSRSVAFGIPNLYNGQIRLNVRGREPQGIVEPGAEYAALLDRIETDLKLLVDPKTGRPAVARVFRSADAFQVGIDHVLPDLFVEWEWAPHFMDEVLHPRAKLVQEPEHYHRSSFHRPTGFVAAAGPWIPHDTTTHTVDLRDLAPTFLAMLEVPIPDTMTGHPLPYVHLPLQRPASATTHA
ncbi:alkaline phosphatase family protein [Gemmatimonas sp.]|uniref:alkaline phosphatase family protein n=1 Tax=Gemmatimonas sp. TaxID=1962908 RepID=UPI00286C8C9E|nr:alkaline phosphatase family protein [Gemmatimonas sp.]